VDQEDDNLGFAARAAGAGWGLFALTNVIAYHPMTLTVQSALVLANLAMAWRAPPSNARAYTHTLLALNTAGLLAGSLVAGQRHSLTPWFACAVAVFAGMALPGRQALAWTATLVVGLALGHIGMAWVPFGPEFVPGTGLWAVTQMALTGMLGFVSAYGTTRMQRHLLELDAARAQQELIAQELIARTHEAQLARDEALAANEARARFIASISHELRTPLNGLLGMAQLLSMSDLEPEQTKMVATLERAGVMLLTQLNQILDFTKIEVRGGTPDHAPFNIREALDDVVDLFTPTAQARGLGLWCYVEPCVAEVVLGDVTLLRQVLSNLVSNAVKFTDEGSVTVRVTCSSPDVLHVIVRDTGVGISDDDAQRLFQPFEQASHQRGGTGLGLAVSRALVERMGGTLTHTPAPDGGSVFTFTVQVGQAVEHTGSTTLNTIDKRAVLIDPRPEAGAVLRERLEHLGVRVAWHASSTALTPHDAHADILVATAAALRERPLPPELRELPLLIVVPLATTLRAGDLTETLADGVLMEPVRYAELRRAVRRVFDDACTDDEDTAFSIRIGDVAPLQILFAEDNPANQEVLRMMLERLGYQPLCVSNGAEAVALVRQHGAIDLVLMDAQMPIMDGLDASRQILELDLPRPPVLVMSSASVQESDTLAWSAVGVHELLQKPIRVDALMSLLVRVAQTRTAAPCVTQVAQLKPPHPQETLLDEASLRTVVTSLLSVLGAHDMRTLVLEYERSSRVFLAAMDGAHTAADHAAVARAAHAFRGAASTYGATRSARAARAIEDHASHGDTFDPSHFAALHEAFEVELRQINELLSAPS